MKEQRTFIRIFVILISFGSMSLLAMITRPSLANIRCVDFVHLIGTGMCFGAAIVALAAYLHGRRSS